MSSYNTFFGFFKIEEWLKNIKRVWNHLQDKEKVKILKTLVMGNPYTNIYVRSKLIVS